ncbi:MAG: TrkA family potassium uptake protein [Methanobacteriaceae archaeon]|nr:TrkA family potassium uptake protein [Methanobacteriaceae archaeon]
MYGIILGVGRVGYKLASLLDNKVDLTLIEKNENTCINLREELDCMILKGNGTHEQLLQEANIDKADFFIAVSGDDAVNLFSCILAKDHGVKKTVARISTTEHEQLFKKLEINTINPELTAVAFLEREIRRPQVGILANFGKGTGEIIELTVTNKKLIDIPISNFNPDPEYIIIAIYESEDVVKIPNDEDILKYKSKIAVLVKTNAMEKVKNLFRK